MTTNKTIIGWSFCDIWSNGNQGRGVISRAEPKAEADDTYQDLGYSRYHKTLML